MARNLDQCRTGMHIDRHLKKMEKQGFCDIRDGKGSHRIVSNERGKCVYPVHASDLGKGLRCTIVKTLTKMGLALFAGLAIYVFCAGIASSFV